MLSLFTQSLWRDEAFSVLIAKHSPLNIVYKMLEDQSPPLYFLLLHYWMNLFGTGELALRTLSICFHILLVLVIYFISKQYIRSILGRTCVVLSVLLNPLLIQYAAEIRPYSLFAFLTALAVLLILKKQYLFASLILSLSLLTHNFAYFNILSIGAWWMYEKRKDILKHLHEGLSLFAIPFLTGSFWSIFLITQFNRISEEFWITEKTTYMFTHLLEKFGRGDIWHESQSAVYLFGLLITVFGTSYYIAKQEKMFDRVAVISLFLILIPITLTYYLSHFKTPIYHERYLISSLPLLVVFVSYGISKLWSENRISKLLLTLLIGGFLYASYVSADEITHTANKPYIREEVQMILAKAQPTDLIMTEDPITYLEVKWYTEQVNRKSYTYSFDGVIPYYIGQVAFDKEDVLTSTPSGKLIWWILRDGKTIQIDTR